jgi:hypothetical protein
MPLSPADEAAYQARQAAQRERHLQAWYAQPDWPSEAAVALMKAVLANDGPAIAAGVAQVDLRDAPPAYAKELELADFRDPLTQPEGTPWLIFAIHAGADQAVRTLLQAGADPVEPYPAEPGTSPMFFAFNALGESAAAVRQAFYDACPGLNAVEPTQVDGYGPLAAVLCHTSPKAIVQADGSDDPAYGVVAAAMREVMARGGAWTEATRVAVLHGAVMCGRPALLPMLATAGLAMEDVSPAGQQTLLTDALHLHRIYGGYLRKDQPTEGGDRQWLAYFAQRGVEVSPQARATPDTEFQAALGAYAKLQAAQTPEAPGHLNTPRRRGPSP